jgi:hypothetical protein
MTAGISVGRRWFGAIVACFVFLGGMGALGFVTMDMAKAATFQPPTGEAPTGNIPVTVWNALDLPTGATQQASAAIVIDGGGPPPQPTGITVGWRPNVPDLNLGASAGGQNVIYGAAAYDSMSASDYLLKLETEKGTEGSYDTRLTVDKDGSVVASGSISARGKSSCFGAVFQGVTGSTYRGNLDGVKKGYYDANSLCEAAFGDGAHVCWPAEMLMSVKCAGVGSKIKDATLDGFDAWMQDGPPGYTAPANDCQAWSSAATADLGRKWRFDSATGGIGFLTTCNQPLKFACCK